MKICLWDECNNEIVNPRNKFCCLSCGSKFQMRYNNQLKKQYESKICKQCNKVFDIGSNTRVKIFCSRSCAATYNNHQRLSKKENRPCIRCSEPTRNKFCGQECASKYRSEKKINDWLSGRWDGSNGHGLAVPIRTFLIKQSNDRCANPTCAVPGGFSTINPITGRCPLEVDHIDGNCYNNSRDNLIVLCPNCHALTPTYRALNKNSGRQYRRKALAKTD